MPPQLTFENLDFRVFKGAELTAEGNARQARFRRDTGDLAAERVKVRFPANATQPETHITATRGSGNVKEHHFKAWDGVRSEQPGEVATTSEAWYSATDGLVRGDKPVEVRRSHLVVTGPGFTLDPRDQVLEIEGGARAVTGEATR